MLDLLTGRRRIGAVVNIPLAGIANSVAIMAVSAGASMVGVKTQKLKRLKVRNNGAGNTWVHIGTGMGAGAFVDRIAPLYSISNTTDDYDEFDLPQYEAPVTWTAYVDALVVGTIDVQIECDEVG